MSEAAELIITPVARRYLTGFEASDGFLALVGGEKYFFADSRYYEAARDAARGCEVILAGNIYDQLSELFRSHGVEEVTVETDITVETLRKLCDRLSDFAVVPGQKLTDSLREMRSVKSEAELKSIKTAQEIAERAFRDILGFIHVGVSEKQIAAELDHLMRRYGAERVSFDTVVVSGKRGSLPHGEPSYKAVEPGDFVTMDFGAVYAGYHSDMTRTVAVGNVTPEMREVYSVVLRAGNRALTALKEGLPLKDADREARDVIDAAGYGEYFGHATGHGVGLEIHEEPRLSPRSEGVLRAGNVVTVEPGVYIPGKFGVRIEDMAYITPTGAVNLTSADKSLIAL